MFENTGNSDRVYEQIQTVLAGEPTSDVVVAAINTLALAVGASVTDLEAAHKLFDAAWADARASMVRNFEIAQEGRGLAVLTGQA